MAVGKVSTFNRRNNRYTNSYGQMYVHESVVPKTETLPKKSWEMKPEHDVTTSRQVRKNRKRARNISPAYAAFLTGAAVFAVFICVMFLKLQTEIVNRSENITALQEELAELTEENDTAYQAAEDSVNIEEVRARAIYELGMVYEAQGSVVEYTGPENDSVTQYSAIPEDGVLAKSRDVSE